MAVQTFEAMTDDSGNIQFVEAMRLPAHTKVYVVVPEQTTPYAEIVPKSTDILPATLHFPSVRVLDEGLKQRLVKTIVGEAHAEL